MGRKKVEAETRQTIDRDRYVPMSIINLATRYSRSGSQLYLRLFGVGITEWRVLSILSYELMITANEIVNIISTNKAAVSRSLATLERSGYVTITPARDDNRKRLIATTPKGEVLHNRILQYALKREQLLLRGFSASEVDVLLDFLRRLNQSLPVVEAHDRGVRE